MRNIEIKFKCAIGIFKQTLQVIFVLFWRWQNVVIYMRTDGWFVLSCIYCLTIYVLIYDLYIFCTVLYFVHIYQNNNLLNIYYNVCFLMNVFFILYYAFYEYFSIDITLHTSILCFCVNSVLYMCSTIDFLITVFSRNLYFKVPNLYHILTYSLLKLIASTWQVVFTVDNSAISRIAARKNIRIKTLIQWLYRFIIITLL